MVDQYLLKNIAIVIFIFSVQIVSGFTQDAKCDMRLRVFLLHKSDFPQDKPVKNAQAKIVNLDTNMILNSQTIDGFPYFTGLSEGKYNIVVSQKNFNDTTKQINLKCNLTDEKNVFDEVIFLLNLTENKIYRMQQVNLRVVGEFPLPASPPAPRQKSDFPPVVIANEIALNERAVYLPAPVFPVEIQKIKDQLISDLTAFVVPLKVEIDNEGNVADVEADSRLTDERFQSLIPYIIESAKKSKFLPIKINGKSAVLRGSLIYNFSK